MCARPSYCTPSVRLCDTGRARDDIGRRAFLPLKKKYNNNSAPCRGLLFIYTRNRNGFISTTAARTGSPIFQRCLHFAYVQHISLCRAGGRQRLKVSSSVTCYSSCDRFVVASRFPEIDRKSPPRVCTSRFYRAPTTALIKLKRQTCFITSAE